MNKPRNIRSGAFLLSEVVTLSSLLNLGRHLQGRASTWQVHSLPWLQLTFRLPAFEFLAQSLPYSKSTKLAHELTAAACATLRVDPVPLP